MVPNDKKKIFCASFQEREAHLHSWANYKGGERWSLFSESLHCSFRRIKCGWLCLPLLWLGHEHVKLHCWQSAWECDIIITWTKGQSKLYCQKATLQDNATQRWNNVTWGQYNFLWPEVTIVMMTFLSRQYWFSLPQGCYTWDKDIGNVRVFTQPLMITPSWYSLCNMNIKALHLKSSLKMFPTVP